jgi:hypothetical protein
VSSLVGWAKAPSAAIADVLSIYPDYWICWSGVKGGDRDDVMECGFLHDIAGPPYHQWVTFLIPFRQSNASTLTTVHSHTDKNSHAIRNLPSPDTQECRTISPTDVVFPGDGFSAVDDSANHATLV